MKRENIKRSGSKRRCEDEDYIIYTETNKRHKITKKFISTGEWTNKENEIYVSFLESHLHMFESEYVRRSTKVFRKMSTLLRRRDSEQCRSHHQKLSLKYNGSIPTIVLNLRAKIAREQKILIQKQVPLKRVSLGEQREEEYKMMMESKEESKHKLDLPTGLNKELNFVSDYQINTECDEEIQILINIEGLDLW